MTGSLAQRLALVRERITAACASVGRSTDEVTLVVVSKTWPAAEVAAVADLGESQFGENRPAELVAKAEALADRNLDWHFIGQIQSRQAVTIGSVAGTVHSVDRAKVLAGLDKGAQQAGKTVKCFVQVNLDGLDPQAQHGNRGGVAPDQVVALAASVDDTAGLSLAGVMTLPPPTVEPDRAFAALAEIAASVREEFPHATGISAGMSHDLEAAIQAGATHVRIGTAVFGERRYVR